MAGKPIATLGSMHVCPMITGYIPHIGGPVSGPGAPNVLINGNPAALMGDICVCVGPPDTIAQGEPTVLINGTPVATMGSMTAHGGSIVMGEPNVMVGSATPSAKATMPLKKIPFPEIRIIDRVGAMMRGKTAELKQAKANQEQIKKEAEEDCLSLTNLQWKHEGTAIDKAIIGATVELTADISGVEDGHAVRLLICERREEEKELKSVSAIVENQQISASWKVAYSLTEDDKKSRDYIEPKITFKGSTTNTSDSKSNGIVLYTWLKARLKVESTGEILRNTDCILNHPTGTEEKLTSDDDGYVLVEELKLGKYKITI